MFWDILYSALMLIAGIGVFLVGIVLFSETLTKSNSAQMRLTLKRLSGSRMKGFGLGIGVTAAVQSSTVTTVMVVSLVNAGLLTLFQATAITMGANIGSTLTSLLVALSTVSVSTFQIKYFFMAMAFIGAFTKLISKKEGIVKVADIFISFGVLFVGLELMSKAFSSDPILSDAFTKLFQSRPVQFPLLAILMGILFTMITQSSAGTMAVVISMVANDLLGMDVAMYLVLGANIGTTLTAFLAAIGGSTNAKRTAVVHFLFKVLGTFLFTVVIWPTQKYLIPAYQSIIPNPVWQITMFNVIFNVVTGFALIGFIEPINKFVVWLVKEHPQDEDILRPQYINEALLATPIVALGHIFKEMKDLTEKTQRNIDRAFDALINQNFEKKDKIRAEKAKIDFLYQKVAEYLIKFPSLELPDYGEKLIGKLYHFAHDIKRMVGHSIFMLNNAIKMKENGLKFEDNTVEELKNMHEETNRLFAIFYSTLDEENDILLKCREVIAFGKKLSKTCNRFADAYLKKLIDEEFTVELGEYVYSAYITFGSIAGYIISILSSLIPKSEGSEDRINQLMIERKAQMELMPPQAAKTEAELFDEVAAGL